MLLKSISLSDFRQFRGKRQGVDFAHDQQKNVTVIMGENGSGKTCLAQAFTWCLYGETEFEDKDVLNKAGAEALKEGETAKVEVEIVLLHNGTAYTITRRQQYRKDGRGRLKASPSEVDVSYLKDGQQEFVKALRVETAVKEILPKELARYFFFDGERIGNLGKELRRGKSQEFALAVRSVLGLGALLKAIEHLKPTSKYSVTGLYNQAYDAKSDEKIKKYGEKIQIIQDEIDGIEKRLAAIELESAVAAENCEMLGRKIAKNAESGKLQARKEGLLVRLSGVRQSRLTGTSAMFRQFCESVGSFLSRSLMKEALSGLGEADKLEKGIPDMHARSIDFLIRRGRCVCGTPIEPGNGAYLELTKAVAFLPPASVGVSIGQFTRESEVRLKQSTSTMETFREQYTSVRVSEGEEADLLNDIREIENSLVGLESVSAIQKELMTNEKRLTSLGEERDSLIKKSGGLSTEKARWESERTELALLDKKNRKIEIYKTYAQILYNRLSEVYARQEGETRLRLEQSINGLFKEIYAGGMSLTIDDKYAISVHVDQFEEFSKDVETSTAQSISVIFAFIAGIIKLARASESGGGSSAGLLSSEPYPLVMDAPLSAFDKRRIKTICQVLPRTAEQVIVMIKDTDGEIAEDHMAANVGARYYLNKISEFETVIERRK